MLVAHLSAHSCGAGGAEFTGLRLTAGRRPSNGFWLMVWEDWAGAVFYSLAH